MRTLLLLFLACAGPAVAQPAGERLQMAIPADHRQTREWREGDRTGTEWRPADQREILSLDVVRGVAIPTPIAARDAMAAGLLADCEVRQIRDGLDNLYPYALWAASCQSRNAAGTRREVWTKAIQSGEALYVVRKIFTYTPEDRDVRRWVTYLEQVQLCDPRLPDRPCRR